MIGPDLVNAMAPELLLWKQGELSVFYAPWDWVNTSAKVMLVGITPGLHQATQALGEIRRCLARAFDRGRAPACRPRGLRRGHGLLAHLVDAASDSRFGWSSWRRRS